MFTDQKNKWWIDLLLFAGFILAFFLDLTGVALHQWTGVLAGALAAYHLAVHWSWVRAVSGRFFGRTTSKARFYYLLDAALLAGFGAMTVTGLVISTWLDMDLSNFNAWLNVHILASIATLLVTIVKLSAHWRWIAAAGKRSRALPSTPQRQPLNARSGAARQGVSRREFLQVLGIVGGAGAVALVSAASSLGTSFAAGSSAVVREARLDDSAAQSAAAFSCSVLCPRGCSYPGHCRRYQDSNQNGRCDLGECA